MADTTNTHIIANAEYASMPTKEIDKRMTSRQDMLAAERAKTFQVTTADAEFYENDSHLYSATRHLIDLSWIYAGKQWTMVSFNEEEAVKVIAALEAKLAERKTKREAERNNTMEYQYQYIFGLGKTCASAETGTTLLKRFRDTPELEAQAREFMRTAEPGWHEEIGNAVIVKTKCVTPDEKIGMLQEYLEKSLDAFNELGQSGDCHFSTITETIQRLQTLLTEYDEDARDAEMKQQKETIQSEHAQCP